MGIRKVEKVVPGDARGARLDHWLADWLGGELGPGFSRARARKLIVAGAVHLDRKRSRIASRPLAGGERVEVYVDLARLGALPAPLREPVVLYEDEWLVAFDKPAGLPTQPTLDSARDNLYAAALRWAKDRGGYIGLHHRLDRDTSGVVLMAKRKEANPGLAREFSEHRARKEYLAIAASGGRPDGLSLERPRAWTVRNHLARDRSFPGKRARYRAVRSGGDPAETRFELVASSPSALLVRAFPLTGRTHQIRVHLAEGGHPILGDFLYGGTGPGLPSAPRTLLHARAIEIRHPMTGVKLRVESPLPQDFRDYARKLALPEG